MTSKWLKIIAAALALCVSIGATGCNKDGESGDSAAEGTAEATAESTEEAADPVKVGYIFHGSVDAEGFSSQMNDQRLKALSHSSVESCYIDNVSISDFEGAVEALIDAGCNKIVSSSSVYTNALTTTAGKYMNVDFIGYGCRMRSVNIFAYTEIPYQGAYVAGMAAAYNSENEKIGIVCDPDMLYTVPVINAAALGVQLVYSDAVLDVAFATKNEEIYNAVNALKNDGCDVVLCYTESPAAGQYCELNGINFIDYYDHTADAANYGNMLMYFYCSRDSFYLSQFKQMQLETWEADTYMGTMANGVVNISDALPAAKDGTQDILKALNPKVASGQAYIFSGELKDTKGSIIVMQNDRMQFAEICDMSWYVRGVNILENFRQPVSELTPNSFEIKS